ncbi:MAG: DinB family protein [Phycisphaerales bacterium]|nr:DinB family protein [Phycisphaerales bacterium]
MSKKAKKKGAKRHLRSVTKTKTKPKPKAKRAAKAPASTVVRDRAVALMKFGRQTFSKYSAGFSQEQMTAQPAGHVNHLLWTIGHLAATAGWALSVISGEKGAVPEAYEKMFGMGSVPVGDAGAYPSVDEVKGYFDSSFDRLVSAVSKMTDAQLSEAVEAGGFASDKADLAAKISWHEGWHVGQVVALRRALGIASPNA